MQRFVWCCASAFTILVSSAIGQVDQRTVERIIDEGKTNSQVWDHLMYLSEEIGTRLTGSTNCQIANEWTRDTFASFGLSNAHLQKWGEVAVRFDRGPSYGRMLQPVEREFEFTTRAWSAGTDGPVQGPVFKAPRDDAEFEAIEDQLEGAWILSPGRSRGGRRGVVPQGTVPPVTEEIAARLFEAGIAGIITASRNDLVVTSGQRGWRDTELDDVSDEVTIYVRRSDYDAINSRLADGEEVVAEFDLDHTFTAGPIPVYNTIADIPGTEFPEQVVIFSGHLDTWDGPGSQGTQDNGTGTSVMLEAARILMASGVKPRRTIRFILWTGEEQGLLGSRAYLESLSEEERANISAVFVDDGGTNYQGGVTCTHEMEPILSAAFAPVEKAFPDMPIDLTVQDQLSRFGGSDHAPFVRAGIPAFFTKEAGSGGREGRNYRYIHHTQHDTPRYAVPEYLVQSATCSAVVAYHLAMIDGLLPREPSEEEVAEQAAAERPEWPAHNGPLTGEWSAKLVESDFDFAFTLSFEHHPDGRVRGMMISDMDSSLLEEVAFDKDSSKVTFKRASGQYGTIEYSATIKGNKMTGTMQVGDRFTSKFEAQRKSDIASAG